MMMGICSIERLFVSILAGVVVLVAPVYAQDRIDCSKFGKNLPGDPFRDDRALGTVLRSTLQDPFLQRNEPTHSHARPRQNSAERSGVETGLSVHTKTLNQENPALAALALRSTTFTLTLSAARLRKIIFACFAAPTMLGMLNNALGKPVMPSDAK